MARTADLRPAIARRSLTRTLSTSDAVAVIDAREQRPLNLAQLKLVVGTLTTGDYSVRNLEHLAAIERKSLGDLLSCVGANREPFDREVQRLIGYPTRAVVVEATWARLEAGGWRSKVTVPAALGSVLGWIERGVPIILAGNHAAAGRIVARILFTAARRRWEELLALGDSVVSSREGAPHAPEIREPRGNP